MRNQNTSPNKVPQPNHESVQSTSADSLSEQDNLPIIEPLDAPPKLDDQFHDEALEQQHPIPKAQLPSSKHDPMPKDAWGNTIIFSESAIQKRIQVLSQCITEFYKDRNHDLVVIGMLKGSIYFMADLTRAIQLPLTYDFTAMGRQNKDGIIQLTRHIGLDIENKDVLVVEEIIRTGLTTHLMIDYLEKQAPASIHICTLLYNAEQTLLPLPIQFVGFNIGYERILGYGIDQNDRGRDLKNIVLLDETTVIPHR